LDTNSRQDQVCRYCRGFGSRWSFCVRSAQLLRA
jgi:hypothetical protein